MSNNQKSETCPNRRDFFLSFKFMFSKQAPPLFIGRPNNFQFNRKVSRENCKCCIWNEVRENILKQSWFIWIMGPHKLSFKKKKKKYRSCAADNSYNNNVPKTCTMRPKKSLSYSSQTFTDTHMQECCEGSNNLWDRVERILWIQHQPRVRHCPDCVFPGRGSDHMLQQVTKDLRRNRHKQMSCYSKQKFMHVFCTIYNSESQCVCPYSF